MKKKVTIDTLARMTQDEFSRVGERFDKMDERFDKMDERFDKMDERFDKMDERFDKMDSTLKTVLDVVLEIPSKKEFERLDNKVQILDAELTSIKRRINR
ncbi:MAG: hypothetical protein HYX21_01095 [Candidatus Yanofskybacteria bacterium]|nr:hypothetical protein [Candidatus Yanofskybacteria bacterium]